MKGIFNLINNLLQPLVEHHFYLKTFPTANEAIEAFKEYRKSYYLKSNIYLVTIQIHDLRTTLSHDVMTEALETFFVIVHLKNKLMEYQQPLLNNWFVLFLKINSVFMKTDYTIKFLAVQLIHH